MDSDIVLPPDALVRLVEADVPIISGLYHGRCPPHAPIAYVRNRRGGYRSIAAKGKANVVVDAVGAGCLLIRRDVLETLKPPWFVDGYRDGVFFTEDFYFCRQAQAAGFEIRVDRRVRPLHIEPMGVGGAAGTVRLRPFV